MTFQPSPLQLSIAESLQTSSSNLLISACAGSGKTTTLLYLLSKLPSRLGLLPPKTLFLAFNKNIAETLKSRAPSTVLCSTFHSLCLKTFPNRPKVDSSKCRSILWKLSSPKENPDFDSILRLVSLCKSLPEQPSAQRADRLCGQHGLVLENDDSIALALKVLEKSLSDTSSIDFDDMLWLPALSKNSLPAQDFVFVDECQDLNEIQHQLLLQFPKPPRFVFVGDPYQAIYGFRGAHADSMEKLGEQFNCTSLPLDVSYRCSKSVIKEAQRILATPLTQPIN